MKLRKEAALIAPDTASAFSAFSASSADLSACQLLRVRG